MFTSVPSGASAGPRGTLPADAPSSFSDGLKILDESIVSSLEAPAKVQSGPQPTDPQAGASSVDAAACVRADGLQTARASTLPTSAYHLDETGDERPSLSASIARILVQQSPAHAFVAHPRLNPNYKREDETRFELGTSVHDLFLEGVDRIAVCDFDNWRTKAAQEHATVARAAGRIPMLVDQYDAVMEMVEVLRLQIAALEIDPAPFTDGKPEQTIVWEDQGVLCRARIDWLHNSHMVVDDLKTSARSAHPDAFQRTIYQHSYDVQARFYARGVTAVYGVEPEFRFIVQETSAPYEISVVGLDPSAIELADAKVDWALATWKKCLDAHSWPGYPRRVCYVTAPAYEEMRWLEHEQREVIV